MLTELAPVPAGDLPIVALRDHLRLGTGFADDAVQDGILEAALRAALAAVEGRTGRALLVRPFAFEAVPVEGRVVLPIGPAMVTLVEIDTAGTRMDVTAGATVGGGSRPVVEGLPGHGTAVIGFTAGFGAWDAVPPDLRQAVLMLAAAWYEDRGASSDAAFPAVVGAMLAPWRMLRLGGRR